MSSASPMKTVKSGHKVSGTQVELMKGSKDGAFSTTSVLYTAHRGSNTTEDLRALRESSVSDQEIRNRFSSRNIHIKKICQSLAHTAPKPIINPKIGKQMLFANNRFLWCRVLKAGSTFLINLKKKICPKNQVTRFPYGKVKSFVMVREPYSRLISAYIGKFVTNVMFWKLFGQGIVSMFRSNASEKEKKCGNDVTFPEFIKYVIHSLNTGVKKNHHFVPMSEVCNPCKNSFDYTCHLETLKDDLSFLLRSVNISTNFDLGGEEAVLRGKSKHIIKWKNNITPCDSFPSVLRKVWWSFQARGLISKDIEFPLSDDQCNSITWEKFSNIAWNAHSKLVGQIDKRKQKREALVDLFLQVPLEDRIHVRDLFKLDFQLFGYDPQPDDLFPELIESKNQ